MNGQERLHSERLCLVPGTEELGRAELGDRRRFARLLGAEMFPAWPPPLNDEASMTRFTEYVTAKPDPVGWAAWHFLLQVPMAVSQRSGTEGSRVCRTFAPRFECWKSRGSSLSAMGSKMVRSCIRWTAKTHEQGIW